MDKKRDEKYTNQYTVDTLFPDENPVDALKREFGKVYNGMQDVYIKIRVELLGLDGNTTTFVMSFHFAEKPFTTDMFPYKES